MEEGAKERKSHQKLGMELDLFTTMEEAPGMPFFLPNGMIVRNELENYWKKAHYKAGYQEIKTPIMMKQEMWEKSGHWDHYGENMYFTCIDEQNYAIKPMSCPGAVLTFNHKRKSYRELPLRYAELGLVHRHELSGSLNGLLRVRSFTQDDAHIFVAEEGIHREVADILTLIHQFYTHFGFQYKVELSTRPEDFMGEINMWEKAEETLESVLKEKGVSYSVNEGDGAFYGPKIDFHILDSLGRSWQCGTVQLDFQMPEKFQCTYIGEDNKSYHPVMIHRAIYGSIERFMAILIEHYNGAFPFWLAPVQVKILLINDAQLQYGEKVKEKLEELGYRVEIDDRTEKIGLKIREGEMKKIPYMFVIGEKEKNDNAVAVRKRGNENRGVMKVEEAIKLIQEEL
ncbi:threonine--tRNA ligase [Priestia endophytica]|uniref:threonine--tRNA ligase n=1 Tax=Priestia endophytica TaxID=135735 RepID=UPI002E237C08|nr:threonine--tRNA ligase [Priestia endophytica]MED4072776.1 threonine--tRNA ligase [Priestia endophytica]